MNYEDLKNIIPANTLSIIDDMIDTLEHKNYKACFLNEAYSYYVYDILAISFVKSMRKNDKYESFISNFPEEIFKFNIQKTDNTYNPNLTKNVLFNNIIPTYEEVSMYRCLTAYDIYRNIYTHMKNAEIKNLMISSAKLINKYNENEKQKYKGQVESEIYKNLSINVINYLDTASVIMHTLLSNKKESLTISDISILALFASLFYYKDTQKEMSISHKIVILDFLKKYDISLSTIDIRYIDNVKPNPFYIKEYFSKYYENKEDEAVENIVQNIFNKKLSKTVYLDKLLSSKGIDTNIFINFKDKINKEYQNMIMMKKEEIVNYFYNELSKNVINYIDFSSKIYKIILDNINNGSVNQKLVKNEDDADTLALFIASFYYNTDIKEYFLQNGITLERVLKLVNLTLDKEKLDNEKVDTSILIDRFDRFIKGGVNKSKKRKDIKINDISYNLCDRNFNKSMIMEELFYNLTENKTLNSNFLNTIKNDLEEKERKRIQSLSKEVFKDLPVDTVLFLEDVLSKYTVMKKVSVYTNEEIKLLSFILSSCKGKYSNFFSEIINIGYIIYYLNNQINTIDFSNIENWPSCFNIETVKEEFMTYIYDLKNKDKLSKEITVIDIFDNAISKDLNSSINVRKLLKYANTDLCNIDEKYKRYEEREKEKKIIIDNSNYLKLFNESTIIYLENALKICEFLKSDNDVPSDKNLIDISLILSLYTLFDDSAMEDLLKRNNLELSKVTNILNINLQDVNKLGKKVNYLLLDNNFKEFLDKIPKDKKNINVGDIILKLLDTSEVLDFIIKELNVEKTIFRREVETGKKYEETLEIEERMNVLLQSKMENFNGDDIGSVINFGNSLVVHSNYVFDSFPE